MGDKYIPTSDKVINQTNSFEYISEKLMQKVYESGKSHEKLAELIGTGDGRSIANCCDCDKIANMKFETIMYLAVELGISLDDLVYKK